MKVNNLISKNIKDNTNNFIPGKIYKGDIAQIDSDGIIVKIKNNFFKIKISGSFKVNDPIFLKVISKEPNLKFEYNKNFFKEFVDNRIEERLLERIEIKDNEKELLRIIEKIIENKIQKNNIDDEYNLINNTQFYIANKDEVVFPIKDYKNGGKSYFRITKESFKIVIELDNYMSILLTGFKENNNLYVNIKSNNNELSDYLRDNISYTSNYNIKATYGFSTDIGNQYGNNGGMHYE